MRVSPVTLSNSGFMNNYTALSFANMMYYAGASQIPCREILCYDNHPISYARNAAVQEFLLDKNNTHLLFLDSDVIVPMDIIPRMLKHDKLVVSGWYNGRGNRKPLIFKKVNNAWACVTDEAIKSWGDKLTPVDGVAAGCLMIKRELFDVINTAEPFKEKTGMIHGDAFTGEDLYFCDLVMKEGIQMYLDPTLRCLHHHWTLL